MAGGLGPRSLVLHTATVLGPIGQVIAAGILVCTSGFA